MVAKVAFNRAKDWIDIEQMLVAVPALDLSEVRRWLEQLARSRRRMRFGHLLMLEHRLGATSPEFP